MSVSMPCCLADPPHTLALQTALGEKFGVKGIPALVVLDGATGDFPLICVLEFSGFERSHRSQISVLEFSVCVFFIFETKMSFGGSLHLVARVACVGAGAVVTAEGRNQVGKFFGDDGSDAAKAFVQV